MSNLQGCSIQEHMALLTEDDRPFVGVYKHCPPDGGMPRTQVLLVASPNHFRVVLGFVVVVCAWFVVSGIDTNPAYIRT